MGLPPEDEVDEFLQGAQRALLVVDGLVFLAELEQAALWQAITAKRLDRPLRDKAVCGGLHPMRVQGTQMLPLLRAVPGPQDAAFTVQGRQDFIHGIYTLTPDCDRMACKLAGTPLLARVTRKSADALGLAPGQPVFAQIPTATTTRGTSPASASSSGST